MNEVEGFEEAEISLDELWERLRAGGRRIVAGVVLGQQLGQHVGVLRTHIQQQVPMRRAVMVWLSKCKTEHLIS